VEEKLYVLMGDNSKANKGKVRKTVSGTKAGIKGSSISGLSGTLGGTLTSILEVFSVSILIALLCEVVKRYWGKRRTHRKSM
jgi:hypothetical protein